MRFVLENISNELTLLNLTPVLQESEHDGDVWGLHRCFPTCVLSKPIKVIMCISRGEETCRGGETPLHNTFPYFLVDEVLASKSKLNCLTFRSTVSPWLKWNPCLLGPLLRTSVYFS